MPHSVSMRWRTTIDTTTTTDNTTDYTFVTDTITITTTRILLSISQNLNSFNCI